MLKATFFHGYQERIDYTPPSDVQSGDVVVIGGEIGVVTDPQGIKAGKLGSVAVTGIFALVKDAATTFNVGAKVFWDTVNKKAVTTAGANIVYAGYCQYAAANGDLTVKTYINKLNPNTLSSV